MEDSSFCWPDGSQAVSNPFTYLNFAWPDGSLQYIEPDDEDDDDDEFFQLPADASSADGLSAIFSNHRSLSSDSPSAAWQQNLNQMPRPVAEPEAPPSFKKPRSSNICFRQPDHSSGSSSADDPDPDPEAMAEIKEMIYQAAAFRPVSFLPEETMVRPRRKNVRISSDPQTAAARRRREQISERIRALQKLVPGGTKMDTASMLDEAANYLKFLKAQVKALEKVRGGSGEILFSPLPFTLNSYMQNYYSLDYVPLS